VTETVGDELLDGRRRVDSARRSVLTAASTGRDESPTRTGSLTVAHRPLADTYRVVPGDTLWAIARRTLGDARRWRDVFDLNEGHRQRDGRTLTDPRLILPGWQLQLPRKTGSTVVPRPGGAGVSPPVPSSAETRPTPAATAPTATPTPPSSAAARPARSGSVWSLVDVGLGAAALGAGVGWVAGRRRRGMTEGAAVWPTAPKAGESRPQTGTVGTAEHQPTAPAASPLLAMVLTA
jgi:LysM repeat protein